MFGRLFIRFFSQQLSPRCSTIWIYSFSTLSLNVPGAGTCGFVDVVLRGICGVDCASSNSVYRFLAVGYCHVFVLIRFKFSHGSLLGLRLGRQF